VATQDNKRGLPKSASSRLFQKPAVEAEEPVKETQAEKRSTESVPPAQRSAEEEAPKAPGKNKRSGATSAGRMMVWIGQEQFCKLEELRMQERKRLRSTGGNWRSVTFTQVGSEAIDEFLAKKGGNSKE